MANPTPRIFSIPASAPFLRALIEALIDGRLVPGFAPGRDPLALASATLYLPTRRAARLARSVFLDVLGTDAAILPRIAAIGDVDEDEIAFAEAATADLSAAALELPEALGGLERRLLLAELVMKWAAAMAAAEKGHAPLVANNPAAALALADDLARLMDDLTTRQVSFDKFDDLVPREMDDYWQLTLRFLKIAREAWPKILAERGKIEPAARRDLLIEAEAARLQAKTDGPVIAAGSTGSIPATAKLLATIAKLPHGAVVLPGLDTDLDEASWDMIGGDAAEGLAPAAGHPQFAMHGLLRQLGIKREAVTQLSAPAPHGRELFLSEALRPATATERWRERLNSAEFSAQAPHALTALSVVEAANAEEEALTVAVALREAVQTPGMTAALITPDRALARRVLAALGRWKVAVDDSGGDRLPDTPAGIFARLAADAAFGGLAPVTLLALLKHPLFRLGASENTYARAIATLEQAVLRGPRPRAGTAGLKHALSAFRAQRAALHPSDPRKRLKDVDLDAAETLASRLAAALAPLESLKGRTHSFADLAARHRDAVLALGSDSEGVDALSGTDGSALADAFEELATNSTASRFSLAPGDYADVFRGTLADRVVRRPELPGVRVRIYGPLEARLQNVDRVVLGGLVEGTWPPETRGDPWLSRPMRHELGLDLPERRIGLSAHDFAQALGAKEILITRAAKLAGAPTVASRFVQRLAAVAGKQAWDAAIKRGACYVELARQLDTPATLTRLTRPEPRPPVEARPTLLAVTDIEHWLRDPYTIYAKHILRVTPLDAVDTPPGAADRGTVIHDAIKEFALTFAEKLPDDATGQLLKIGAKHFAALEDYPEARAFWWPRFRRIAEWLTGWERARRVNVAALHAEIRGESEIPLGHRVFRLSARADRIEKLMDGRYAILDYKTGAARTEKQVRTGLAPQLTLEAAILRQGGFKDIAAGASVAEIAYVTLRGVDPAGEFCPIDFKEGVPDSHADRALARLMELAARFANEETPYRSLVHPMWKVHYGDYDHLARVKEWSATGGLSDEAAE